MARERLGVALLLPEPVRREVDGLRRAVGDGSLHRVPAHVTLVPPVNVNARDLEQALELIRDAAEASPPLRFALGPPATFLPDNAVLYLTVTGDLEGLMSLREAVFRPPLARDLAWPFVPHVTLCDEGDPERIAAAASSLADYRADVTFTHVHLMEEQRGDGGARVWRPVADAALGGRAVVGRGGLELEITESEELDPAARQRLDAEWAVVNERSEYTFDERPFALTARREGESVGFAVGWTNRGAAYLGELMTIGAERGIGVGRQLLLAFEDLARRRGCDRLGLWTTAEGGAEAFYERHGWWREFERPTWIDGTTAVYFRKDL